MSADHPVFTRLTRQQRIIRRRTLGFQTLVFSLAPTTTAATSTDNNNEADLNPEGDPEDDQEGEDGFPPLRTTPSPPPTASDAADATETQAATQCKVCARWFETYWKPFLCHVCGLWVCEPCSSVVEREREHNRITFVRCCADCLRVFDRWMPDPDALADVAFSPTVVSSASAAAALGFNMAEAMRGKREWRRAVVDLLRRFGRPVGSSRDAIDAVSEDDWLCTAVDATDYHHRRSSHERLAVPEPACPSGPEAPPTEPRLLAQYLVQQCYEVQLEPMAVDDCRFAEDDGTRSYALHFDWSLGTAAPPAVPLEQERLALIRRLGLLDRAVDSEQVQLLLFLATKELNCANAVLVALCEQQQVALTLRCVETHEPLTLARGASIVPYMLVDPSRPFLARDLRLDVRFRHLPVAAAAGGVAFVLGVPVLVQGVPVAVLVAVDAKPRRTVSTVEYAVLRTLADVAARVLEDESAKEGGRSLPR